MSIATAPRRRLVVGRIQPKQAEFMRHNKRYVAYGGARGGGKSWALRAKFLILAAKYPGIKMLLLRRTYGELYENHLKELLPQLYGIAKYRERTKEFIFPNGSIWTLGYCANDNDYLQYQGPEYDVIGYDEAGQFKQDWINKIDQSVRGVNDFPKRSYYTLNPGGVSHAYFKRLFIDRDFLENENPDNYVFTQALVTDNLALMRSQPEYIKNLESMSDQNLVQAWRYGNWDISEGAFFEEFRNIPANYQSRRNTHVIEPFDIPPHWAIYRSFDWGYNRPFACSWWAVTPDDMIYNILELYGMRENRPNEGIKWTDDQIFTEIARIEREHDWLKGKRIIGVADPSIWKKGNGIGISTAEIATRAGVFFTRGDNDRIAGWRQFHYRLRFDEEGYFRVQFFSNCKHMNRTIPLQMYDQVKLEDLDSEMEDHLVDEARYLFMARPMSPEIVQDEKPQLIDPLTALDKQIANRRRIIHV